MFIQAKPDEWWWLLITILAVWRFTSLICYDAGPFDLLTKFRILLYKLKIGSVIECFHCAAVWISIAATLFVYQITWSLFIIVFAIAGGASIIEKIIFNRTNPPDSYEDQ